MARQQVVGVADGPLTVDNFAWLVPCVKDTEHVVFELSSQSSFVLEMWWTSADTGQ